LPEIVVNQHGTEKGSARVAGFLILRHGAPMSGYGTILLVDDDPLFRDAFRRRLEDEGFHAVVAANGSEAIRYLKFNSAPSLILLDMMMPRVDGWQLMGVIRQQKDWSRVPVIVTTSMGVASEEWAESLGAVDLLKKPFDDDELMRHIRLFCSAGPIRPDTRT
jgi:CheY-like chemotaxis protein